MQNIEEIRAEVLRWFDPTSREADSDSEHHSPDGRYSLRCTGFRMSDPRRNWVVLEVCVIENASGEQLFKFVTDHDESFHAWLVVHGTDYLIFPEAQGGQTVFDLTHRKFASHFTSEDEFIWVGFHLSPSRRWLAIQGCYWACPDSVMVYDFSKPLSLPLPKVREICEDCNTSFSCWTEADELILTDGQLFKMPDAP
ncbi:hypothetical protein [Prosthecobacter sp.]|uniref:hypothetical protein n=1 Tax=Prosthecobacter sp. TaxID=1965333 RepID=UPI0037841D7D